VLLYKGVREVLFWGTVKVSALGRVTIGQWLLACSWRRPRAKEECMAGQIEFVVYLTELLGKTIKDKPVAAAYLYGSAARGEMTPLSDADIGLLIRGPLSLLQKLDLELSVEVELASLGCGLSDVRVVNEAPIALRGELVTEGILLYSADESERAEFETRARREYFDFLPFLERLRESYLRPSSEKHDQERHTRGLLRQG
jgi:predicted nucleotidyltransferase